MPRPKRNRPNDLKTVHDRRTQDLLRNAWVTAVEIDDPLALEPGDKIIAFRSNRCDPLGKLHAHKQIDDAQYQGGRAYQTDWERAEVGSIRAIDPSKEAVDGGRLPEAITDEQIRATNKLIAIEATLGLRMREVAQAVLIRGLSAELVALENHRHGRRWIEYYATMLQDILHSLAFEYGFALEATGKRR